MFKNALASSSYSVDDIPQAKEFYGQTLGVEVSEEEEGLARGGDVFIYPKPNHEPATFTAPQFPGGQY